MKIAHANRIAALALGVALTCLLAPPADAAFRSDAVNATGACNGALPSYEGAIRKRPLAIANEGTSSAFVSCSIQTDGGTNSGYDGAVVTLLNRTAASVDVSCTLISGVVSDLAVVPPQYFPKTIAIAANGNALVQWNPVEEELETFLNIINFSCNLPPGVEIALIGGTYDDGIAAP